MAKETHPVGSEDAEVVIVSGSWTTNGANNPVTVRGQGYKVVAGATGEGTAGEALITFDEKYAGLLYFGANLHHGTAADQIAKEGSYTAPTQTAKATQMVRCWDISSAAVAEWPAAGAGNEVHFIAIFRRRKKL